MTDDGIDMLGELADELSERSGVAPADVRKVLEAVFSHEAIGIFFAAIAGGGMAPIEEVIEALGDAVATVTGVMPLSGLEDPPKAA